MGRPVWNKCLQQKGQGGKMTLQEAIEQLKTLIEVWYKNGAVLNQTDIDAMEIILKELNK